MNTYTVECQACGHQYEVEAASVTEAIEKARVCHEEEMTTIRGFRCDTGPFMTSAKLIRCDPINYFFWE